MAEVAPVARDAFLPGRPGSFLWPQKPLPMKHESPDHLAEFQPRAVELPLGDRFRSERLTFPLLLVLREDLHRPVAVLFGLEQRVVQAAGNGQVGAEHRVRAAAR